MAIVIVTGSSGLIGSEAARFFHEKGFDIVGIDNNLRQYFFGKDGSVEWNTKKLKTELRNFTHYTQDIRDAEGIQKLFKEYGKSIAAVIHTAAQPSHDWAAKEPMTDFTVNAMGTLVVLEAFRAHCPDATFIFTSTNKVYGDTPNRLPVLEGKTRWTLPDGHAFSKFGIPEEMTIDNSLHSLFGASKVAADVLTQEFGRYFGLKTAVFRGGCLTGPSHSAAELHGFLGYLVKCVVSGKKYTIFGYKGKQVRDNIHSFDLVNAFWHYHQNPHTHGEAYNMGGGIHANCSVLEAIGIIEKLSGKKLDYSLSDQARSGDHIWWISDVRKFEKDFPKWKYKYDLKATLQEMVEAGMDRKAA